MKITDYVLGFYRGYVTAMLWANTYDSETGEPMESGPGEFDPTDLLDLLTEDTQAALYADAAAFVTGEWDDLRDLPANPEQSGHDFALTRNGHGAGFWDRGYGEVGERLSNAARGYGECSLYRTPDEITVM